MSTVFYRWGAGRDESRVTFDGTHISVFDLKREVILANKMGNGKDFDLGIFDNVTGEEFKDDHHQIPRSSSLIARRLPASAKGRGNAQHYIAGTTAADSLANEHRLEANARQGLLQKQDKAGRAGGGGGGGGGGFGSMTKRFDGKEDKKVEPAVPISTGDADEDAKIQAMFAQNADQWEQMQEDMSSRPNAAVHRARTKAAPANKGKFEYSTPMDKEPPAGYICYRCGQKGHWIQDCPNGDDPAAAEKKRFVRVTGIPRSFLKTVETPGNEGSSQGAMLTADGGFVQAMPDRALWQKLTGAKPRTLTNAEVRDQQPLDASITCPICKKLIWEAVRVPCCRTSFCEECIQNHLLEHDFECPTCESKVPSLDALVVDDELRDKVKGYVDGEIERSRKEKEEEDEGKEEGEGDEKNKEVKTEVDPDAAGNTVAEPVAPALDQAKVQEMMNPQTMQTYLNQVAKMMQNPKITADGKAILQAQLQMVQSSMLQMQMMMMTGSGGNGNIQGQIGAGMGMGMGMMPGQGGNGFNPIHNNMNMGMPPMGIMPGMGVGMPGMGMMEMAMNMNMGMGMPMVGGMGMGMGGGMNQNQHMGMGPGMGMGMGQGPGMGMNPNMMGGGGGGGHMGQFNNRGRGGMPFRGGGGGFRGRGGGGGVGPRSGIPIPTVRPPKRSGEEAGFGSGGDGMDYGAGEKAQRVM